MVNLKSILFCTTTSYSVIFFSSLLKKEGRRKGKWSSKTGFKPLFFQDRFRFHRFNCEVKNVRDPNPWLCVSVFAKNTNILCPQEIVLFKSLRNSKRRNKGNFTSKSNSNKIKLCGGGGQHYLVLNKFSAL